ncbi:MAG: hypothetical protein WCO58_00840 [bacterium]
MEQENKKLWFEANPSETDARPNKVWFRAKSYGWGWTPCTWQGWAVLVMYLFVVYGNLIFIDNHVHSDSDFIINFFPNTYIVTVFLIIICYATGEKPSWRWGKKEK